jgi:hypothetical protein
MNDTPVTKVRKWRRRIIIGCICFTLIVTVGLTISYLYGRYQLDKVMAETNALDAQWRLVNLEGARISPPDDQNSAFALSRAESKNNKSIRPENSFDLHELVMELFEFPNHRGNASQKQAIADLLKEYRASLPEYRSINTMPIGRYPLNFTSDFISTRIEAQTSRLAANVLTYDFLEQLEDSGIQSALWNIDGVMNASSAVGDEPTLISMLVRMACQSIGVSCLERALAQFELDERSLTRLKLIIERESRVPLNYIGLRGERAVFFEALDQLRYNPAGWKAFGGKNDDWFQYIVLVPGLMETQQAAWLGFMNKLVEVAKKPIEEQRAGFKALEVEVHELPPIRLLIPAFHKVHIAACRSQAQLRQAIVAIAAEQFRSRNGRWPSSIEELVHAKLLDNVPLDPFDSKPIRWKTVDDGPLIYSVGVDGNDDNGSYYRLNENKDGYDFVFRLFDSAKRQLPPRPIQPKKTDELIPP